MDALTLFAWFVILFAIAMCVFWIITLYRVLIDLKERITNGKR